MRNRANDYLRVLSNNTKVCIIVNCDTIYEGNIENCNLKLRTLKQLEVVEVYMSKIESELVIICKRAN